MATGIVTLSTVADTTRRALAKYPNERARIERGAALLTCGNVARTGPDTFSVESQSRPKAQWYLVTVDPAAHWAISCSCEDARRQSQQCKHAWSCTLLLVAEERQRRLEVRSVLSATEIERLRDFKRRYEKAGV